jgi:hypothetical protein
MSEKEEVNHPKHYNSHPSGIECIDVVEHMGFNLGNAIKYIWRADEKGKSLEDLNKACWYITREIEKREKKLERIKDTFRPPAAWPFPSTKKHT